MNGYDLRRDRRDQVRALEAKSDAELAALGLTREAIPARVFADLIAA